jgi:hypothetical protein
MWFFLAKLQTRLNQEMAQIPDQLVTNHSKKSLTLAPSKAPSIYKPDDERFSGSPQYSF